MRHLGIAPLIRAAGINDDRPAKAFGFHLFEIAGDGFPGHVAVQPPPVGAQAGAVGRIGPAIFQCRFRRRRGGNDGGGQPGAGRQEKIDYEDHPRFPAGRKTSRLIMVHMQGDNKYTGAQADGSLYSIP